MPEMEGALTTPGSLAPELPRLRLHTRCHGQGADTRRLLMHRHVVPFSRAWFHPSPRGQHGQPTSSDWWARPLVEPRSARTAGDEGEPGLGAPRESFLVFARRAHFLHRAAKKMLRARNSHPTAIPRTGSPRKRQFGKCRVVSYAAERRSVNETPRLRGVRVVLPTRR